MVRGRVDMASADDKRKLGEEGSGFQNRKLSVMTIEGQSNREIHTDAKA